MRQRRVIRVEDVWAASEVFHGGEPEAESPETAITNEQQP